MIFFVRSNKEWKTIAINALVLSNLHIAALILQYITPRQKVSSNSLYNAYFLVRSAQMFKLQSRHAAYNPRISYYTGQKEVRFLKFPSWEQLPCETNSRNDAYAITSIMTSSSYLITTTTFINPLRCPPPPKSKKKK